MGLLEKLFKPKNESLIRGYFRMLNGYNPSFHSYSGSIYEMEITRAAIHALANHTSKLKPEMVGSAYKVLGKVIQSKMNPWQDTTKFLYHARTIYEVDNFAFIVPVLDDFGDSIQGYATIRPSRSELVETKNGDLWLKYHFTNGQTAVIEWERVGVVSKFLLDNQIFGETNSPISNTLSLIDTQNQGIVEGIKQSATIRFMAKLASMYKPEDIELERKRFTRENLSSDNNSGVMMFDNKYADVQQINSKPFVVDAQQMAIINTNIYNYFGVNEDILQNKNDEKGWQSFYEGAIEPFAIQLSLVMTNMTFSDRQIAQGNGIMFSSNRMQYADNRTKLQVVSNLFDRGFMTHNEGREVFNMPKIEGGDKLYIRGEYVLKSDKETSEAKEIESEE